MSYILEALKKSEKERKKEGVPDLQADHSLPPPPTPERKSPTAWLAGIVVLFFFGGGGWFMWQGQQRDLSQPAKELQLYSPSPLPASPEKSQAPKVSTVVPEVSVTSQDPVDLSHDDMTPIPQEEKQAVPEVRIQNRSIPSGGAADIESDIITQVKEEAELPVADPMVQDNPDSVFPLLDELPAELRKKIPELSFAGHVYADTAEKRLIMINNRIVREGDLVSKGLLLQEITRDGVIIRYESFVFRVKLF